MHRIFPITDKFISNTIQRKLFLAFEDLHANILETCSYDRNAASRVLMVIAGIKRYFFEFDLYMRYKKFIRQYYSLGMMFLMKTNFP